MVEPGLKGAGLPKSESLDGSGLYATQPDRAQAIALAIASADDDDVVLIAGKGHEDYQIVGREKRHFADREQALAALEARSKGGGHASL